MKQLDNIRYQALTTEEMMDISGGSSGAAAAAVWGAIITVGTAAWTAGVWVGTQIGNGINAITGR